MDNLLTIWEATGVTHSTHWTFYIIIVTGVLGFAFSSTFIHLEREIRYILIGLFILFAIASFVSIWNNHTVHEAVLMDIISKCGKVKTAAKCNLDSISSLVFPLHVLLDFGVIAILWKRAQSGNAAT